MKITLELYGHYSNSGPVCLIQVNDQTLYNGTLEQGTNVMEFNIQSLDLNTLRIHHLSKSNEDTVVDNDGNIIADKAIELKSLCIEQIKILDTVLYNKPYYVQWPDNLEQDFLNRGETVPQYIKNTLFFGFNGYYEFDFVGDFLKQYYRQFWENEDQAHNNQTKLISVDGEQVELFDRFGEETAVDQVFDLTIHDLARMIQDE